MDFFMPEELSTDKRQFDDFLSSYMTPHLGTWHKEGSVPRDFFLELGRGGWLGFDVKDGTVLEQPALKHAVLTESLAALSPGVAVTVLVHISLGTLGLFLFASSAQRELYLDSAMRGETLVCLGNTEPTAGSDVANIATRGDKVEGGWVLNGTKAYVTNGSLSEIGLITAVTDAEAPRSRRLSMFVVDLSTAGITRKKLKKQVWIPSDLTRLQFKDVFVPDDNLLGMRGRGLQQVLEIFTHSRVTISALTLGTAVGAFNLGLQHAQSRKIFGRRIIDFQAKSFEAAEHFSRIEAARLMLWKACWKKERREDFRLEASIAKYLTVEIARAVSSWAADLFGAASVMTDHPIHKFPMDAWASSLGEGTQDVQKLIIFRELVRSQQSSSTDPA
jgi:alkylation response protein AidB-like acyl-CoA dehydrogenase